MILRKIGLEAEVILLEKRKPVIAGALGFPSDDYSLLAEIRAEPGDDWIKTMTNFYMSFRQFEESLEPYKLKMNRDSWMPIPIELHRKVLLGMGTKEVPEYSNIHEKELSVIPDIILGEDGNISNYKATCGLHLHFSMISYAEFSYRDEDKELRTQWSRDNVLTDASMRRIIEELDNSVYEEMSEKYVKGEILRNRAKGTFERKKHGFEYRSLPFSPKMFTKDLEKITKKAWDIFHRETKLI
jgi:hypothetical protein